MANEERSHHLSRGQAVKLWGLILAASAIFLWALGCTISEIPQNMRNWHATNEAEYPWLVKPIDEEHKSRLCVALTLSPNNALCQPGAKVMTGDLIDALKKRFPEGRTTWNEVHTSLEGFPMHVEESVTSGGAVTSRGYAYRLTQFQGFLIYFFLADPQSDLIVRIHWTKVPGPFD